MITQHAHNAPGAFSVGLPPERLKRRLIDELSPQTAHRLAQYDIRAVQVNQQLPAGSSAGSEQQKISSEYSAALGWNHCIVKFTPAHGIPFDDRWRALLILEALALRTLEMHDVDAPPMQVLHSTQRTYLQSQRFDRLGMEGKQHVVAIAALHDEFAGGAWQNWLHTSKALV